MTHLSYILAAWIVSALAIAAYCARLMQRGRRLSRAGARGAATVDDHRRDGRPDPSMTDATLDLTPRAARGPPRRRRWLPIALVVAGGGRHRRAALQDARRRDVVLQERRTKRSPNATSSAIDASNCRAPSCSIRSARPSSTGRPAVRSRWRSTVWPLDVVHVGNPPELFKEGEAVVLEGRWTQGAAPTGSTSRRGQRRLVLRQ